MTPQLLIIARMPAQVKVVTRKGYTPDFSRAFEHFLLHTGGRGVIDELEEKLHLTPTQVQPSKDTLYRFGNTSAASTWCGACLHRLHCRTFSLSLFAQVVLRGFGQLVFRQHLVRCGGSTWCAAEARQNPDKCTVGALFTVAAASLFVIAQHAWRRGRGRGSVVVE